MARWDHYTEDSERYTAPLRVMLLPSQMAQLKREAEGFGIKNFSDYTRKKLTDERMPQVDAAAVRALAREINAIGVNYNQMVKQAHSSGRLRVTEELDRMGVEIVKALEKVMAL
jgi:hypothetical protein